MAICKDCTSHDICEKHKRLMLTLDNNFELIYQNGVQVSCRNFKDKSQYVEVVRCKDCKHCDQFYPNKKIGEEPELEFFCKIGKHRTTDAVNAKIKTACLKQQGRPFLTVL